MNDEAGSMRVEPDGVCYCGWAGLDDSGCLCVHPELRMPECLDPSCDDRASPESFHGLCEDCHNKWANSYLDPMRKKEAEEE